MAALLFVALFFSAAQDGPQSTAARPAFEVASIKLDPSCETGGMAGRAAGITAGGLNIPCVSLRALIRVAYSGVITNGGIGSRFMEVLGGPGWLDTDRYDIAAKAEGRASQEQVAGPMLQALLEDRFHLKVHKEPRDTSVYLLTVAKNGAKLQPTKEGSCVPFDLTNLSVSPAGRGDAPRFCGSPGGRMGNGGTMVSESYGITMAEFAGRALAGYAGRPVIDQTGLTGRYDIHLEFVRDNMGAGTTYLNGVPTSVAPADTPGPSIFAALEGQLGLKLSPGKSPLDVIVVDHAEKPTAN